MGFLVGSSRGRSPFRRSARPLKCLRYDIPNLLNYRINLFGARARQCPGQRFERVLDLEYETGERPYLVRTGSAHSGATTCSRRDASE